MLRHFCAASVVVLGLIAAPAANAASPGINLVGSLGDPSVVQAALDTGAKEVRIFADWSAYEPAGAGQFDPSAPPQMRPAIANGVYQAIHQIKAAGRRVLISVTNAPAWANGGAADAGTPPTADHVGDFAAFVAKLLHHAAQSGDVVDKVEIWNEPDEQNYWHAPVDPARYTALLRAAFVAINDPATGSPQTEVLTGPSTGNNYPWIQSLYDNGAKGFFDGVAVHTDNSCLVDQPDRIYTENGRLGRFTLLGVREIRATLLANGEPDKQITVSEIGISSTNGGPTSCNRGTFAGQKPNGVSEAVQADYLTAAFMCLANEPYVAAADWFHLNDTSTSPDDEFGHYGLLFTTGQPKPAYARFVSVAQADGGPGGPCGDLEAPAITVLSPRPDQTFEETLDIQASATDTGSGLARLSFFLDAYPKPISNVTEGLVNGGVVGLLPWSGQFDAGGAAGKAPIALGDHAIRFVAVDRNGNTAETSVPIHKVAPGRVRSNLTPAITLPKRVTCDDPRCRRAHISGRLSGPAGTITTRAAGVASPSIAGKVACEWQWKNKKRKWRKLVGGLKPANKPFTFKAKLKKKGQWRVRVVYQGKAPYRRIASKFLRFRVR